MYSLANCCGLNNSECVLENKRFQDGRRSHHLVTPGRVSVVFLYGKIHTLDVTRRHREHLTGLLDQTEPAVWDLAPEASSGHDLHLAICSLFYWQFYTVEYEFSFKSVLNYRTCSGAKTDIDSTLYLVLVAEFFHEHL